MKLAPTSEKVPKVVVFDDNLPRENSGRHFTSRLIGRMRGPSCRLKRGQKGSPGILGDPGWSSGILD